MTGTETDYHAGYCAALNRLDSGGEVLISSRPPLRQIYASTALDGCGPEPWM